MLQIPSWFPVFKVQRTISLERHPRTLLQQEETCFYKKMEVLYVVNRLSLKHKIGSPFLFFW